MRTPADLPPELHDRAFSIAEARTAGVGVERLRRGDLVRPFHGVRASTVSTDHADRARDYAPRLRPEGFLSHTSAAAVWGLPLPTIRDPRIHVADPHGTRAVRTVGVIGHHLVIRPDEITEIDGIRLTTPVRTWTDLAGWIPLDDLVAVGDRILWRHDPLASLAELADMVDRHPGHRGRRDRLLALPRLSDRADSRPETRLRCSLIRRGFPIPEVNVPLVAADGSWIGQPDLAFGDFREAVEYEGDGHRSDPVQWRRDLARVPRFEQYEWHVTRAGADDLADDFRRVAEILDRCLRAKGWPGPAPR